MQPFSWSKAELLASTPRDHTHTEKRYSLNNEDFEFDSPLEVFGALDEQGLLREGAHYYAGDFSKVEPDCFDIDELLEAMETQYFEKFEPSWIVSFTDVDEAARTGLRRAIDSWVEEHVFVGSHWCLVGTSQQLLVAETDLTNKI